ncbi:peptidoglycan DD-metalloendopeptidase family protein [Hydrogenophaga sp.]|uniref:peptidoglycan DD-metalloendopeptidase family protein n=1 Tax=Hydrogenophaga sp. TaxID=1904254 RepID=UPI0019827EAF|nr:peptidoglycan DD-metalloendopeptidase family protein [Hydrogenophaga sp.]MBD3892763.1 LysM peptidoglycan-binding domain-containing protein [Hydrogenophaga sp.]
MRVDSNVLPQRLSAGVRVAAGRGPLVLLLLGALLLTAGCSTRRVAAPAPVEDRSAPRPAEARAQPGAEARALPGAENEGRPGYYTVRPGDTLIRIGLETGQSWRDLQAWNNLGNPNLIEVGQVLRVVPPLVPVFVTAAAPPPAGAASPSPVLPPAATPRPLAQTGAPAPATPATPTAAAAATPAAADEINLIWPAQGEVISVFDEVRNKGIAIAGRLGEPVLAAAAGRVVYAGAGLRGYGNLIILKHDNTFLTAYAHNQALLVREDQVVRQGQRIAEMGSSDADRVKLHFELRRQGRPVDPLAFLPRR